MTATTDTAKRHTVAETFEQQYQVDPVTGCHIWQRAKVPEGYGMVWVDGRNVGAHVFAWYLKHGRWPQTGLVLDHRVCDTPSCVNADHLVECTNRENTERGKLTRQPRPGITRRHLATLDMLSKLDEPLSQRDMAARLGASEATVQRHLVRLEDAGLIVRRRQDAGWSEHRPDRIDMTTDSQSVLRAFNNKRSKAAAQAVVVLSVEVLALQAAMRAAGLSASFANLYPEVVEELTEKVRQLGVGPLVRAAVAQTWGAVRHVAAYLTRWRELRPPRPTRCPFHPAHPPRGCPECAEHRAKAVPMPSWLRDQFRTCRHGAHVAPPMPVPLLSA